MVKQAPSNQEFDFPRSSLVSEDLYRIVVSDSDDSPVYDFGRNPKDIAEFSIYSNDNKVIKTKVIKPVDSFKRKTFDFTDYGGVRRAGSLSLFDTKYEVTEDNELVLSPTHELRELGEQGGSFLVGVSMKQELIGSYESTSKLLIQDISPSRTEIKIIPSSLKTSLRPLDVALNVEYLNYFNKKIPVSHIFYEIPSLLSEIGTRVQVENLIANGYLVENLKERLYELVDFYNFASLDSFSHDCDGVYNEIKSLYLNTFLYNYNSTYTRGEISNEYEKCIDYILNKTPKFKNTSDKLHTKYKSLYKEVLMTMFNFNRLGNLFDEKFESYLSTSMVFETGEQVSVLSTARSTDNISDPVKHRPLLFKLQQPLSHDIKVGASFHLLGLFYSDDIIQRTILYKKVKPKLYKLRNPDLSGIASQGTRSYTSEQLNKNKSQIEKESLLNLNSTDPGILEKIKEVETEWREEVFGSPIKITEEISNYFNNQTEDYYLSVDYSDFKNFIRYSSARKRLDVFILKLTKISKYDRELEEIRKSYRASTPEKFGRLSYDTEIERLNKEKVQILNSLDGYERFLYFEDITELTDSATKIKIRIDELMQKKISHGDSSGELDSKIKELEADLLYTYISWPRAEFNCDSVNDWSPNAFDYKEHDAVYMEDHIYILTGPDPVNSLDIPGVSDRWSLFCSCDECVGKKIPLNTTSYSFLTSRDYYRPMPIPEDMEDFSKTTGYTWYSEKAREAEAYDKQNDNSFANNTPEFIVRDPDNEEYFEFLSFIGHQFDLIHLYVEGVGNIKKPLNNPDKGIPNELVSHMLGYFGGSFEGYDEGEINSLARDIKTDEELAFVKKFKQKKHLVWRRILNNLPYILKTKGTEKSIRALFRCYGVPDYLFKIREFGGIEYNTETSDKVLYTFDSFDYFLKLERDNQYIELDWKTETYQSRCVELKFSFNEDLCDITSDIEILASKKDLTNDQLDSTNWSFGFASEPTKNHTTTGGYGWGKFYIKIGQFITYLADIDGNEQVYGFSSKEFNVLIQVVESERWTDSGVEVFVKRYSDEDLVYNGYSKIALPRADINNFLGSPKLIFGNYYGSNFFGTLDRLRIYTKPIKEARFENHIKFNQSYDVDDPHELEDILVFKANFDFPYKLNDLLGNWDGTKTDYIFGDKVLYDESVFVYVGDDDNNTNDQPNESPAWEVDQSGVESHIQNTSFRKDSPEWATVYNFTSVEYPYDFGGSNKRNFAKLPAYGSQVFNNSKIRIETQILETQLSVSKRSTKKSGDRLTIDTNKLGVYFSPSDLINHEILRFFGDFDLGDYIGDPSELYNKTYSGFNEIKNLFFKNGFGRIDFSYYLSILESYLDPSLFKNIEKIIPARTLLVSGLVVEPSLLERSKIQRRPIDNELVVYDDIHINVGIKNKNITDLANNRSYYNLNNENAHCLKLNIAHTTQTSNTYPSEFNSNVYENIPDDLMYGISSYRGTFSNHIASFDNKSYERYVKIDKQSRKYNSLRIYGSVLKNSNLNCQIFGSVGGSHNPSFYVHKDVTLNGIALYDNLISSELYINDYALFSFSFSGHIISGRVHGWANVTIQNGTIKNFIVNGRFGGTLFSECDLRLTTSQFSDDIDRIIYKKQLSGAPTKSTSGGSDSVYTKIISNKTTSEINLIKIPDTISHRFSLNIDNNTFFTLKNNSGKYITADGLYRCRINMFVASELIPPPICTFNISWTRIDDQTNKTNDVLNFKKSAYDYVHNLQLSESTDLSKIKSAFELPELVVTDTTKLTTSYKKTEAEYSCEDRLGRYEVPEIINRTRITSESNTLDAYLGEVIYRKSYKIPFNFNQSLKTDKDTHESDLKLAVNYDGVMLNLEVTDSNEIVYKTNSVQYKLTDLQNLTNINFSEGVLSVVTVDNFSAIVGDVVLLTDSVWSAESGLLFNLNETYYTFIRTEDVGGTHKRIILSIPDYMKNWPNSVEYVGGGILHKLPSEVDYYHKIGGVSYKLTTSCSYHNDPVRVSIPKKVTTTPDVGDTINCVFREGAFLWKEFGLRVLTNAVVLKVSQINDIYDKQHGETLIRVETEETINGNRYVEFVPSAEYVYAFSVIPTDNQNRPNYQVELSTKYNIQLGPSPSPISIQKIYHNILIDNIIELESPFDYFNIVDVVPSGKKILNGNLKTHRRYFSTTNKQESRKLSRLHCRRSSSNLNNTISPDGITNNSPPIVRTRRSSLKDGMGDSFWYLEDKTYSVVLPCGVGDRDVSETPTPTTTLEVMDGSNLNSDSLVFYYTFENVNSDETLVYDLSGNERDGNINLGLVKTGGLGRQYKKVMSLDNNIKPNQNNTNAYIEIPTNSDVKTDKCTISFWIKPIGESADNSGIVFNNSTEPTNRHGVVINPNGNKFSLGYTWTSSVDSYLVDLNVKLEEDAWNHVSIIIYKNGITRVFLNKTYVKMYDLGVYHDMVNFDKLEVGRFSGMIDDIRFYTDELSFGEVELKTSASGQVAELYDTTRDSSNFTTEPSIECQEFPFLRFFEFDYYQDRHFTEASIWYSENVHRKEDISLEPELAARMKHAISGGPNEGMRKFASVEFMGNLCGRVKEAS